MLYITAVSPRCLPKEPISMGHKNCSTKGQKITKGIEKFLVTKQFVACEQRVWDPCYIILSLQCISLIYSACLVEA